MLEIQKQSNSLEELNKTATLRDIPGLLDILGNDCISGEFWPTNDPNCPGILQDKTIDVTGLPDYPGCTFTVMFKFHVCRSGLITDIAVGDYQIVSHDCQKFSNEIANGYFPDLGNHNDLRENFEIQMYEAIEDYVIAEEIGSHGGEGAYICGTGRLFEVTFYSSSCYRYCYELYQYIGGLALWNQIKIGGCGTECCEVHTRICFDEEGNRNKVTEYNYCLFCPSCQYDPTFYQWEIEPCEVPGTMDGISIYDTDPTPTPPPVTDCIFSCKEVD